ncbi:hypothetical protein A2U01_0024853, partial [Trifolium medium]|nr:hypothetical protein [Trifolium medium]
MEKEASNGGGRRFEGEGGNYKSPTMVEHKKKVEMVFDLKNRDDVHG